MIIEFIAVPGSGKTFFSDKLYTYLKKESKSADVKLFNRHDINLIKNTKKSTTNKNLIRLNIIKQYLKVIDFYLLKSLWRLFVSNPYPFKTKTNLAMYLIDIFSNYKIINDLKKTYNNKCLFVLDESLLHASSIGMDECNAENLDLFYKNLKSTKWNINKSLFIFIDCDIDTVYSRLSERTEDWPVNWRGLSSEEKREELDKSYRKFKAKKDYISQQQQENYYIIDNSTYFEDYELCCSEILEKIDKLENL